MSKHILVVDSSRVIRTLFSIYGQQAGYLVIVVSNLLEARLALQSAPHAPDMLFLALHPGQKDERQLAREVQSQSYYGRTMLVLMLTQEMLSREQKLLEEGRTRALIKPFHVQEMLALLSPYQASPVPPEHKTYAITPL